MWRFATVVLVLVSMALPAAARQDRIYTDVTFNELKALMERQGYGATLSGDEWQDPFVHGALGDLKFRAYGNECAGVPRRCKRVYFSAGFKTPTPVTVEKLDSFNEQWVFGKAYKGPDGTAYVDFPINLSEGVTEGNLLDNLKLWSDILKTFTDFIGWRKTS